MNELSSEIKQALVRRGLKNTKEASLFIGISNEALRTILAKGHIPRDRTLRVIAEKLGLDAASLVLTAHRDRVPAELKGFFLAPAASPFREGKRVFPLSQEQCDYLGKLMSPREVQLVRQYRQLTPEGKTEIAGFIDYQFAKHRNAMGRP